jgi:hypothetical protein
MEVPQSSFKGVAQAQPTNRKNKRNLQNTRPFDEIILT